VLVHALLQTRPCYHIENINLHWVTGSICKWYVGALAYSQSAPIIFVIYVRPSVRLQVSARLPLDTFPWNMVLGDSHENMSRNPKFGYSRTKISRPRCGLLLLGTLSPKRAVCEWNVIRLLGLARRHKDYANVPKCYFIRKLSANIAVCWQMYMLTKINVMLRSRVHQHGRQTAWEKIVL
jgi:hypothetical protein